MNENTNATNTTNGNGMTVSDMIQMVMYLDSIMESRRNYVFDDDYEKVVAEINSARIERGYYLRAIEAECESA